MYQKTDRSNLTLLERITALEDFQDSILSDAGTESTAAEKTAAKAPITIVMLAEHMVKTAKVIGVPDAAFATIADSGKATSAAVAQQLVGALTAMGIKPTGFTDLLPVESATLPAITEHLIKLNQVLNMPVTDYEDLLPA